MLHVVHPLSLVLGATSEVEGAFASPLTAHELADVGVAKGVLRAAVRSARRKPDVLPLTVLEGWIIEGSILIRLALSIKQL